MSWFLEHGTMILEIIMAILAVASMITGLTKSEEDDKFIKKLIDFVSFLTPKNAPGTFKMPLKKHKS